MADDKLLPYELKLDGKVNTADDPTLIGKNYQAMKNLRYSNAGTPEGVLGMTKINTTQLASARRKIKSLFHFNKTNPSGNETHVLAQAWDTTDANPLIIQNTTAIPSQGDFASSALHTNNTAADIGRFSIAPNGDVAFCNGKESLVWGGNESQISQFINYNPSGAFNYNYSDIINNNLTDSENIATLHSVAAAIDSSMLLYLALNNNVTDSSTTTPHTVTNVAGAMTFDATNKVFGSHAGNFNGTSAYLTIPDNADFDFTGGTRTIVGRFRCTDLAKGLIYYQQTDANNYEKLWIDSNGAVNWSIFAAAAEVLSTGFKTANSEISVNTFYEIMFVESGDNWYIFINGTLKAYLSDASRAADFTGLVQIGYDGTTYFKGQIDEFAIFNTARATSNYEIPVVAFGSTTTTYFYIGTTRPIGGDSKGIKYYVNTANTQTGTKTEYLWTGAGWSATANPSDGTASAGVPLAQTAVSYFDSTVTTAKPRILFNKYLYWYLVTVTGMVDAATILNQVTVYMPFQPIVDLWDGELRACVKAFMWDNSASKHIDVTSKLQNNYDATNSATFLELNGFQTTDILYLGFLERQAGFYADLDGGNTTANTILSANYSGNGSTWSAFSGEIDDTADTAKSMSHSGFVTWNPATENSEFKLTIDGSEPFYFYKITFSAQLATSTALFYVAGIPAQQKLSAYKFPFYADNASWLCCDMNDVNRRNVAIRSIADSTDSWNGSDSTEFAFGDITALTGATTLYSRLGASIYFIKLFYKDNEIWGISGNNVQQYSEPYLITDKMGCNAPATLDSAILQVEEGQVSIAISQGISGIYMFDNTVPREISKDISNFFDPTQTDNTRKLHASYVTKSQGFIDLVKQEYHWKFADATSTGDLNREWVFSLKKGGWFEIPRGTGNHLQCGCVVTDTNSNKYTYAATAAGFMCRLGNGTTFDGNTGAATAIAHELWLGDAALNEGSISRLTRIRKIALMGKAKTTTTNSITATHYGDGSSTATGTVTLSPGNSGKRIIMAKDSTNWGKFIWHSVKLTQSTSDETKGFEPTYLRYFFKDEGEDI